VAEPPLTEPERVKGRRVLLIDAPGSAQTYFWIANVGWRAPIRSARRSRSQYRVRRQFRLHADAGAAHQVGTELLGTCGISPRAVPGEFAISSFTQTASTGRALDVALQTLSTLKQQGVSDAAIDSARSYILGQYALGFETAADWAGALADLDLYTCRKLYRRFPAAAAAGRRGGLKAGRCQRLPGSEDVDIVLIGDAARIRAEVSKLGPVVEKPLEAADFEPPSR